MSNLLNQRLFERRVLGKATRDILGENNRISQELRSRFPSPESSQLTAIPIGDLPELEAKEGIGGLCKRREKETGNSRFLCKELVLAGLENMHKQGRASFPEPENDLCISVNFPLLTVKGKLTVSQVCQRTGRDAYPRTVEGTFQMRIENVLATSRFRFDGKLEWVVKAGVEISAKDHVWKEHIKMDPMKDIQFPELAESKETVLQLQIAAALSAVSWEEKVAGKMKAYCESDAIGDIMKSEINKKLA